MMMSVNVIWLWKGDYWNLGAGAEIGIYYTTSSWKATHGYYEINTDLTVHATMHILYGERPNNMQILNSFEQTNWWITSFTPSIQFPDMDKLEVLIQAHFTNEDLYQPFENAWWQTVSQQQSSNLDLNPRYVNFFTISY
jgi:hypothetical protein